MGTVEVLLKGVFQERVKPLQITAHRRPKAPEDDVNDVPADPDGHAVDYLGALVERHTPLPTNDAIAEARAEQRAHEAAVVDIFVAHLKPEVVHEGEIREFVGRYGPLDLDVVEAHVVDIVETLGADPHIHTVLRGLRDALGGGAA